MQRDEAWELLSTREDTLLAEEDERRLSAFLAESGEGAADAACMEAVSALFAAPPRLAPPRTLIPAVMERVRRYERRRLFLRRLGALCVGLVLLTAACCVPIALLASMAINSPSVAHALVRLGVGVAEIGQTVLAALGSAARLALAGGHALWLVAWAVMAVLLVVAWLRLVSRARLALVPRSI